MEILKKYDNNKIKKSKSRKKQNIEKINHRNKVCWVIFGLQLKI